MRHVYYTCIVGVWQVNALKIVCFLTNKRHTRECVHHNRLCGRTCLLGVNAKSTSWLCHYWTYLIRIMNRILILVHSKIQIENLVLSEIMFMHFVDTSQNLIGIVYCIDTLAMAHCCLQSLHHRRTSAFQLWERTIRTFVPFDTSQLTFLCHSWDRKIPAPDCCHIRWVAWWCWSCLQCGTPIQIITIDILLVELNKYNEIHL